MGGFAIWLALLLCALSGVAQAAPVTIAEFGEGAGEVDLPVGVAVHQASGDVYIADRTNRRVLRFDVDGKFELGWGFGVRDGVTAALQTCGPQAIPPQAWCFKSTFESNNGAGNILPAGVAVDQATGAVYVADVSKRRVTKFTSSGQFVFLVGRNANQSKVALGGGATQAEKNICTAASGDTCTAGTSGTGANEFASPRSLAVTPVGAVWVGDTNRLKSFDENGVPGTEIALAGAGNTQSLALESSGNFYVKSASLAGIRKLEAGTGTLLGTLDAAGQPRTVTLDAADNVYVGDLTIPYRFLKFNPAGEQVSQFGAGEVLGTPGNNPNNGSNAIAIGEDAKALYAVSSAGTDNSFAQRFPLPEPGPLVVSQSVTDLEPTAVTLNARINPEGDETTYRFEYGTTESYGSSTPTQTLAAKAFESEDVEAGLEDLIPDTTYHFRVVATNHCNPSDPSEICTAEGEDQTFRTPPSVVIDPQWTTDVTAHSAVLHAELNPLGAEAEAWVEYGPDPSYGEVLPLTNLGDGSDAVKREIVIALLQAFTIYHYRFVGRNERDGVVYTVYGPDRTFTTQFGGLGFELADDRVWEMVTPPSKQGARLVGGGEVPLQASADGNGIAYQSMLSTEANPEGIRSPEPSMSLASRDQADGLWRSEDITPPNDRITGVELGKGTEYKLFNSDLSEALLDPRSGTPLSPEASERTIYLRENTDPPAYTPLVTGKEPNNNVPPGTEFGGSILLLGVSPNFEHFALKAEVSLGVGASNALYERSKGTEQLKPISVLPLSEGGGIIGAEAVGSGRGSVRGAISEDGSRVFWSRSSLTALYVRDTETEESARLDVKESGASGIGTPQPIYQGASADGRVVFFTDSQHLTEDASSKGFDLYRCELPAGSIASGCATLANISVPIEAGESAGVEGIAAGITENGETIYFVARGVLDDATNQLGDSAVSGEPNIYLWSQGKNIRFIATLADEDTTAWGEAFGSEGEAAQLSASIAPNGRYLAFMSQRGVTEYDNRDATTGEPVQELYRYDALTDQLVCVSCTPTGGRPHSATPPKNGSLVNPQGLWSDQRTAATLPQATTLSDVQDISLYRPRAVLDNGRIFFNAVDSLVPADSNGQWDAYQYEPIGVGNCLATSGGTSVSRLAEGCVSLLSSGTAEEEAAFFDASETGDDAFFFTPAQLSVLDEDEEVDIYDARVNGIEQTLSSAAECLGEACQPLAQPPSDPTPASAAFHGPGNLRPAARKHCPKGKRPVKKKGKVRCVARKHRKASANRRAGR